MGVEATGICGGDGITSDGGGDVATGGEDRHRAFSGVRAIGRPPTATATATAAASIPWPR